MKEVELGRQLCSLLKLPAALDDRSVIAIYASCCACGKRILTSELSVSRLVQESESPESFIKKANALVYRRSTQHEENCKWGIPTIKVSLSKEKELVILPQARSRREWQLRRQMLRLRDRA
jgi:hypothetical protein